jgi:hypothetical protein
MKINVLKAYKRRKKGNKKQDKTASKHSFLRQKQVFISRKCKDKRQSLKKTMQGGYKRNITSLDKHNKIK